MADENATLPPGYATSVQAALGISPERTLELNRWLFETVLPSCSLKTDVLDMINAGRGIENLTQTEKLYLCGVEGAEREGSLRKGGGESGAPSSLSHHTVILYAGGSPR